MLTARSTRLVLGCVAAVTVTVTACAPVTIPASPGASQDASLSPTPAVSPSPVAPRTSASVSAPATSASPAPGTASGTASVSQSASTSPTAAWTGDPGALIPGRNHIGSASEYVYPAALVQQWLEGEVKPTEKVVFLTFDDGPNHKTTPMILDALDKGDAHATFFVVGSMLDEAPELLRKEIEMGNSIALHSWSHNYKKLYPGRTANAERVADEYTKTLAKIRSIVGAEFNTEAWRYPGGHMSWKGLSPADEYLKSQGVSWIDWNAATNDAEPKSRRPKTAAQAVEYASAPIRDGYHVAVILAHDTPDKIVTAEAVPGIIAAYKAAGYKFGIIS